MLTIPERSGELTEMLHKAKSKTEFDLRVCGPGIIQSFDPEKLTCTVQMAIRERLNFSGALEWAEIPLLTDVPVMIQGTADYFITFPIVEGTECLVVFGDNCMDAWWQSGGVQNQVEKRRHDLSDGFAIIGPRSQVNLISDYSTDSVQIRNKEKTVTVEIKGEALNLTATGEINLTSPKINVNSDNSDVVINNRKFLAHTHKDIQIWAGKTGGVE